MHNVSFALKASFSQATQVHNVDFRGLLAPFAILDLLKCLNPKCRGDADEILRNLRENYIINFANIHKGYARQSFIEYEFKTISLKKAHQRYGLLNDYKYTYEPIRYH